jgi:hypothetical protein
VPSQAIVSTVPVGGTSARPKASGNDDLEGEVSLEMRWSLVSVIVVLCGVVVNACGGVSKGTGASSGLSSNAAALSRTRTTPSGSTSSESRLKRDRDNDYDSSGNSNYDKDDSVTLDYGHEASAADMQAVTALVERYYAAAAADDGAQGCSLMYSILAEAIPEDYGQPPAGPPSLRGKTCAVVMSKLFNQRHQQLAADSATLKVIDARVEGNRGFALLSFKAMPARSIVIHRERDAWKIYALLDAELP